MISTFPETGSRNIGDQLISDCTEGAIRHVLGDCSVTQYFRAAPWDTIAADIRQMDHIVFACLAVRERRMFDKLYPYARQLMETGIPYTILSAGTELSTGRSHIARWSGTDADEDLLLSLLRKARGVSTRGVLTQSFLSDLGADCRFCGDIAFFDPKFDATAFRTGAAIRRIAISDPHYWPSFYPSLIALRHGLSLRFPEAEIVVALHGRSGLRAQLEADSIPFAALYEAGPDGLDFYDDIDLHVGFRVHGHVSALKRRKYSYLAEQDGRGADYGAALWANVSTPCFLGGSGPAARMRKQAERLSLKFGSRTDPQQVPAAIYRLLAMVQADAEHGFSKFRGLERQIDGFNDENLAFLSNCLHGSA